MDLIQLYSDAFIEGILNTFIIAGISWTVGLSFGIALGFFAFRNKYLKGFLATFSFLISAIPVLVLLFWLHYPLQSYWGISIDPFVSSTFLFAFINTILVASAIETGSQTLPKAYYQCAKIYGLERKKAFLKIELPLILRAALPGILNTQVVILHMTLFASLISVDELFRVAQRINSIEYKPVEIYTIIAGFYLLLSLPILLTAYGLKKRFANLIGTNN